MYFSDAGQIVKDRLNIVDVIASYIKLDNRGKDYSALCPFHKEKTPSFHINEADQYFYCFGCHESGDAISFVMKIESVAFRDAVEIIAKRFHIPELLTSFAMVEDNSLKEKELVYNINREAALFFHKNLMESKSAVEYLNNRSISNETIKKFGLGYVSDGNSVVMYLKDKGFSTAMIEKAGIVKLKDDGKIVPYFFNRIIVPVQNSAGKVIAFGGRVLDKSLPKYLNSPETPVFSKKRELFGLNHAKRHMSQNSYIIVTEGYFDVIALHQGGINTAVASLGTAITDDHLTLLAKFRKKVILLLDGDNAGRKAIEKTLELNIPENIDLEAAFIPFEGEDPDSIINSDNGREKILKVVDSALPVYQYFIDKELKAYNLSVNVEDKTRHEAEIRRIFDKIPPSKKSAYSRHVKANADIFLTKNVKWQSTVRERSNARKVPETQILVSQDLTKKFHAVLKAVCSVIMVEPSYVKAIEEIENSVQIVKENGFVGKLIDSYYRDSTEIFGEISAMFGENIFKDDIFAALETPEKDAYFKILVIKIKLLDIAEKINRISKFPEGTKVPFTVELKYLYDERKKLQIEMANLKSCINVKSQESV